MGLIVSEDPRAGTTIEWPPYLQTCLTATAMRVVNRSRLEDKDVLTQYWNRNVGTAGSQSVMDSLLQEQKRAELLLGMINVAVERAEECKLAATSEYHETEPGT